jgi:hypothetical protein
MSGVAQRLTTSNRCPGNAAMPASLVDLNDRSPIVCRQLNAAGDDGRIQSEFSRSEAMIRTRRMGPR